MQTENSLATAGDGPSKGEPVPFLVVEMGDEEKQAALSVLDSGMLAQGKRCAELEERFAKATDARYAVTCSNGTTALQLAYAALVQPGDDVLVPAWTFIATASMIVARGANPVWCDVNPRTYNLDVEDARRKITPKTSAIAVTHLYGNPANITAIEELAREHNLKVIYDAAQAHFATYAGKGIGAFGNACTYSFYATKNMTCGEGGMVTTNDPETAEILRSLRSHGETQKYLHERIGYNYRLNEIMASIALVQLHKLPARTARRREIAARYNEAFANLDGVITPQQEKDGESSWHLYTLQLDPEQFCCNRDNITTELRREGIGCAVHYPRAVSRQPVFADYVQEHPPISDGLGNKVFSLPVHPALTDKQVDRVIEVAKKILTESQH